MKSNLQGCLSLLLLFSAGMLNAEDAAGEKAKWLSAKLYGSDNAVAAARSVTIREEHGKYFILVANQFTFECQLEFGANGEPSLLRDCRQTTEENKGWSVKEAEVALKCKTIKHERVCKGRYTLQNESYSDKAEFAIARRL